jgi:hypothetical protein
MTKRERLLHETVFEVARRIEEVLSIPRHERARMFFELFVTVRRGLEEFNLRAEGHKDRLAPGNH